MSDEINSTPTIEASLVLEAVDTPATAIAEQVKRISRHPGVYLMKDGGGQVIYVGKAKELRARVRSYFAGGDGRSQIEYLIKKVSRIDTIVTQSENQAFVLERDLISKYKPRYNIRLKDDKAYLSIRLDEKATWPRLELVRRTEQDGARYFGPYSFSYELRNLLEIIKRVVPLRTCTDTVFQNRQRPCLEYQIKRCAGPCCLDVPKADYQRWVRQAIAILEGKSSSLIKEFKEHMEKASAELRFEDAARIRDRIETLENTKEGQSLVSTGGEERDVFSLYREDQLVALSVLRVRFGRIYETVNFSFADVLVTDAEVLEAAISQFYLGNREIPEELVTAFEPANHALLTEQLSTRKGKKIEISVPQRGVKQRLVGLGQLNARQHFVATFESESRAMELSKELARILGIKQIPRRIECVDISNLQGSDIVGALVTFFDGEPNKSLYRKYNISFQDKPDDFAAIYEVVHRRLSRGIEENDLPDLLIIDGGAAQLRKACEARDALKISVDIVGLAKIRDELGRKRSRSVADELNRKPERFFLEGKEEPIALDGAHPLTHFVQRIRNEVHRFVISFHRSKRGKRVFRSALDEIAGLGPSRRTRLLTHFGSVNEIKKQSADELAKVGRMPKPLAVKVLKALGVEFQEIPAADNMVVTADQLAAEPMSEKEK